MDGVSRICARIVFAVPNTVGAPVLFPLDRKGRAGVLSGRGGNLKMKLSAIAAIAALGVALSGCASIIKGSSQSIAITTPPVSGASCVLSSKEGNWSLMSPGVVTVEKSKEDIQARCTKSGYQDGVATIPSNFQGWTVGNLLLGGVIGLGVDAATGAINEYPHAFQIPMFPANGGNVAGTGSSDLKPLSSLGKMSN